MSDTSLKCLFGFHKYIYSDKYRQCVHCRKMQYTAEFWALTSQQWRDVPNPEDFKLEDLIKIEEQIKQSHTPPPPPGRQQPHLPPPPPCRKIKSC